MSDNILIALDMDGILVDMMPKWIHEVNARMGTSYSTDDVTTWDFGGWPEDVKSTMWEILYEDHFLLDVDPVEGAIEAVREIHDTGARIVVITAPPVQSKTGVWDKQHWLQKHLPFLGRTKDYAVYAHAKYLVTDPACSWSILVDDRDKNLIDAVTKGYYTYGAGLKYKYNEHVENLGLPITLHEGWAAMKDYLLNEIKYVGSWERLMEEE